MGRWKSDAYQSYIRTPPQELAKVSKYLVSGYIQPDSHKLLFIYTHITTFTAIGTYT